MKNTLLKIPAILALTLSVAFIQGCTKTPEQIALDKAFLESIEKDTFEKNQKNIKNEVIVGTTLDGQQIKRINIEYICKEDDNCNYRLTHFIYFVGNTTSDNHLTRIGKSTSNETNVILGKNPTPKDVIIEAERLKKAINDTERQNFLRAKEIYEELKPKYQDE